MATAATLLHTPFGDFSLTRYPARQREPLQAWCAADTLLLSMAQELGLAPGESLVVNDEHGALTLPLAARALWTDSALAATALGHNAAQNALPVPPVRWSTETPERNVRCVFMRVPKHLPYFEFQLATLAGELAPGTPVVAGGMDKHLSPHTAASMERWLGPTTRHRGRFKARLFSAEVGAGQRAQLPDFVSRYRCDGIEGELTALPNVFSAARLDIGSRFLIEQLARLAPAQRLVDLACGNGVLGLQAMINGLARHVLFCDESAMAMASARDNASRLLPQTMEAPTFLHGDGLADYAGPPVDLVLCNPPFHLGSAVDEFAGLRLLRQCSAHLSPAGRLCMVANRHLGGYLPLLRRLFGEVDPIAGNAKFNVYLASRPAPRG